MENGKIKITYKDRFGNIKCYDCAGKVKEFELKIANNTPSRLNVILIPNEKIELINVKAVCKGVYDGDDAVFCNGYQTWTTSMEYTAREAQKGLSWLTRLPFVRAIAGATGDYLFTGYTYKKGDFHSYSYTYIKHKDGTLTFYGSLNENNGFTVFYFSKRNAQFAISRDVEGLITDKPYELFNIIRYDGGYDEVFDKYFEEYGVKKPRLKQLSGYTSWYNYFQKIDEGIILRDLNGLQRAGNAANIFQIDDGYEEFVGDFLDVKQDKFPRGMKFLADEIHARGLLAGIWLAPFAAERKSRVYREHPDWLIRNRKGRPVISCPVWSYAATLNFDIPECREYIVKMLKNAVENWGYDLLKLDFLYAACLTPRNGKTRGMLMREAMELTREAAGEKTYILGCGVPLASAFGIVDACRISCDVALQFNSGPLNGIINNEIPNARNAVNNGIFRRHLSGRVFANDPDVFFLRDDNLSYTEGQKLTLAKMNNMFGDILFVSDNVGNYSEEKLELLKDFFTKKDIRIISCDKIAHYKIAVRYLLHGKETSEIIRLN
jgi:alpha-galactosidase